MSTSATASTAARPLAPPHWREELNARLAAHRERRGASPEGSGSGPAGAAPEGRSAVAARVAARYAAVPSYGDLLAASATAAAAAAEAARAALQVQDATEELLASLAEPRIEAPAERAEARLPVIAQVEHPEPLPARSAPPERGGSGAAAPLGVFGEAGADPLAEAVVPPAVGLPAKLIEFPRELVAAERLRPRLAEGPLSEEPGEPAGRALRIFEVDAGVGELPEARDLAAAEAVAAPAPPAYAAGFGEAPGWHGIELGEHPHETEPEARGEVAREGRVAAPVRSAASSPAPGPLHVAAVSVRVMAALVDGSLVGLGFLASVYVFALAAVRPPVTRLSLLGALVYLLLLAAGYGVLFLRLAGETPGMRYAGLALCTFADENPTRAEAVRRVWATAAAMLPLGLGVLWAFFDGDRLGWHDRMTRTYQRSYR